LGICLQEAALDRIMDKRNANKGEQTLSITKNLPFFMVGEDVLHGARKFCISHLVIVCRGFGFSKIIQWTIVAKDFHTFS
jgi:hypothetical protein